jgi:hypothetical protein
MCGETGRCEDRLQVSDQGLEFCGFGKVQKLNLVRLPGRQVEVVGHESHRLSQIQDRVAACGGDFHQPFTEPNLLSRQAVVLRAEDDAQRPGLVSGNQLAGQGAAADTAVA